jgi:hypothetical protein
LEELEEIEELARLKREPGLVKGALANADVELKPERAYREMAFSTSDAVRLT